MRPTLDEFLDSVKDISRPWSGGHNIAEHYYEHNDEFNQKTRSMTWDQKRKLRDATIHEIDVSRNFVWMTHETGGYSGGSCWDHSDPRPYHNSEPMPQFTAFYEILERIVPNLTFLQSKVMEPIVIIETSDTVGEYYGNSTDYAIRYVNLVDLYNYLVEKELI